MLKLVTRADLVSFLNAAFGFLAIVSLFTGEIRLAFSLILLALLADGLDGIVARRYGIGKLGGYLEAMADMTSLALAPLVFMFTIYENNLSSLMVLVLTSALFLFFLFCSIIRLASFHLMKQDHFFVGLPASVSTIFLVTLSFFGVPFFYVLLVLFLVSIAMISPMRFPKPDLTINAIASLLIISAALLGDTFHSLAPLLLVLALAIYALVGPLLIQRGNLKR